jgi:CspA family cold shock protein
MLGAQIRSPAQGRRFTGEGPVKSNVPFHSGGTFRLTRLERSGFMATGKVKWFNDQKGFGFIASEIDAKDVFVHHSVIESEGFRTLADGETVEYDAEDGPKGLKATRVKRTSQLVTH